VVIQFNDHPNARELWNTIKLRLRRDNNIFLSNKGCRFSLNNITEYQFIETVRECDTEKRKEYEETWGRVVSANDQDDDEDEVKEGYQPVHPIREEVKEVPQPPIQTEVNQPIQEEEEVKEVPPPVPQPQQPQVTASALLLLTIPELKAMCRQNNWRGWSRLRKIELVEFIVREASKE